MENNESILEARGDKGWSKLPDNAPQFVKTFVTEYRRAELDGRPMNRQYLASYNSGAETRSLTATTALDFGRKLFHHSKPNEPSLAFKKAFVEKHFPKMTADEIRAHRLKRQGEAIQADAAAARAAEQLEADIRQVKREMFPWEQ
jgi:hypothetical protein